MNGYIDVRVSDLKKKLRECDEFGRVYIEVNGNLIMANDVETYSDGSVVIKGDN